VRILYHHRTLGDGAEGLHIHSMVEAFRTLGHEVTVRGLAASSQRAAPRAAASMLRQALPAPAFELASAAANVAEYLDIGREIQRFRPDALYKRHARYDVAALTAAHRAGIPSVLEVNSLFTQGAYHGFEPLTLRGLAARFERRALELASVVIAVSTPLARQIAAIVPRPVIVMPNGVDVSHFDGADATRVRVRHGLTDALTIGWSGILREWHGVELLLEAFASLPEAQLLIVGDGPARQALERRAKELGIGGRMIITGRVPHDQMPGYIAVSDVAVIADERTGIASPMKLLEYMAMRRAVVAPRLENIQDVIDDGIDGLLFRAGDSQDMGAALRRLAASPETREKLGTAARRKVERERTWEHNARSVIALLESCTGSNRPAP
jgi:glycosyltransferase involved in cell wall biosynthesis